MLENKHTTKLQWITGLIIIGNGKNSLEENIGK